MDRLRISRQDFSVYREMYEAIERSQEEFAEGYGLYYKTLYSLSDMLMDQRTEIENMMHK